MVSLNLSQMKRVDLFRYMIEIMMKDAKIKARVGES